MKQVTMIGIDLAKRSFQVHGARADGSVALWVKLSRERLLNFLASQPRCAVAMEACASAHYWGRKILQLGEATLCLGDLYPDRGLRQRNAAGEAG